MSTAQRPSASGRPGASRSLALIVLGAFLVALATSLEGCMDENGVEVVDGPRLWIDPNTAPPEVLLALPRLGPAMVDRLIEARRERPFTSMDDLDERVRGIGPATRTAIEPFLAIDAPTEHP